MPLTATSLSNLESLEKKLESQKAELRDLATMGTVITSIHDIDAILSVVMDMAVGLVNGEVGMILLEENSQLVSRISWGVSESFVRSLVYEDETDLVTYCFDNQKTAILNNLRLPLNSPTSKPFSYQCTQHDYTTNKIFSQPINLASSCEEFQIYSLANTSMIRTNLVHANSRIEILQTLF